MADIKNSAWAGYPERLRANWQVDTMGPLPTELELQIAHAFAQRGPGKQALAHAQMLRKGGMTANQMRQAAGAYDGKYTTAFNHVRAAVEGGEFVNVGNTAKTLQPVNKVYQITLTAKGLDTVRRTNPAAAEAWLKATGKVKGQRPHTPRPPKPVKVKTAPAANPEAVAGIPEVPAPQVSPNGALNG